jgi:ribosomal protein S6
MNNITDYIASLSNEVEKVCNFLEEQEYNSKELEYAIQKLSEALYWLTYVEEDLRGKDNE